MAAAVDIEHDVQPPAAKLRRIERDNRSQLILDVGSNAERLKEHLGSLDILPLEGSLVIVLHDGRCPEQLNKLHDDGPRLTVGAVPVVAFDVQAYQAKALHQDALTMETDASEPVCGSEALSVLRPPTDALLCFEADGEEAVPLVTRQDLQTLPCMVLLFRDGSTGRGTLRRILSKEVKGAESVQVTSLIQPIYDAAHMYRVVRQKTAPMAGLDAASFTILWMSAAWCPPCLRILSVLPTMLPELPKTVHCVVKADMDLTQPIFDAFGVSIIPTFVIIDNKRLFAEEKRLATTCSTGSLDAQRFASMFVASRVDSLQNSQHATVQTFIEKHCAPLSFGLDDDADF